MESASQQYLLEALYRASTEVETNVEIFSLTVDISKQTVEALVLLRKHPTNAPFSTEHAADSLGYNIRIILRLIQLCVSILGILLPVELLLLNRRI